MTPLEALSVEIARMKLRTVPTGDAWMTLGAEALLGQVVRQLADTCTVPAEPSVPADVTGIPPTT